MKPVHQSPDDKNWENYHCTAGKHKECSARDCNKNGTEKVPFEITITGEKGIMRVCREHYVWIQTNTGNDDHHEEHEDLEEI